MVVGPVVVVVEVGVEGEFTRRVVHVPEKARSTASATLLIVVSLATWRKKRTSGSAPSMTGSNELCPLCGRLFQLVLAREVGFTQALQANGLCDFFPIINNTCPLLRGKRREKRNELCRARVTRTRPEIFSAILRIMSLLNLGSFRLILASKSPRRAEILSQVGLSFDVRPPSFDEDLPKDVRPIQYVESTAVAKGQEVFSTCLTNDERANSIVLAADTIVEGYPGEIWEKPRDATEATAMLKSLSNRSHDVHTGVAIVYNSNNNNVIRSFVVTTSVKFIDLDDGSIADYVSGGSPLDKAGGYGVQDMFMVESIHGDYANVVGMPISRVLLELRDLLGGGKPKS